MRPLYFNNGVYDLDRNVFHKNIQCNYSDYLSEDDNQEISRYLEMVFPDDSNRQLIFEKFSAVFDELLNDDNEITIFIGSGNNGKNVFTELLQKIFTTGAFPAHYLYENNDVDSGDSIEDDDIDAEYRSTDLDDIVFINDCDSEIIDLDKLGPIQNKSILVCNRMPVFNGEVNATVINFDTIFSDETSSTYEEQLKEKRFPKDVEFHKNLDGLVGPFMQKLLQYRKDNFIFEDDEEETNTTGSNICNIL